MVVPAGAVIGAVLGAAFVNETNRRGRNEERREKEKRFKELETNLQLEMEKVAQLQLETKSNLTASELLEKAKLALEKKVADLEKQLTEKTAMATEEKESRERLVSSLKSRVKSVLEALQQSSMEKEVLVKVVTNLFDEDFLTGSQVAVKDENTLAVTEYGNLTVKNTLASPTRMLRLVSNGSNKKNVLQESTNTKATKNTITNNMVKDEVSNGGQRFRIPFFSKSEERMQVIEHQQRKYANQNRRPAEALVSNRSNAESTSKEESTAIGAVVGGAPASVGKENEKEMEILLSPNGKSLVLTSAAATGASQRKVSSLRKRIPLFEGKKKQPQHQGADETSSSQGNVSEEKLALDYEVENTSQFGSSIIIKSHRV